ncbi:DUF427-domain-containing protein [Pseudovirgaria hyperparasitica]|uniref:DUF427-domain-containing protein n=1 Tax=Pseudovirgaria hyperparasitica TaxID=470096 RepID=A0A6A6WAM5_9PEZI|nr:DUF427-domain-containing protein [Pseudovirgaria hyperparasitica]KAF2759912.1 DUF427-domain-containing protein [Pseudovirgaria hyperparasitica]
MQASNAKEVVRALLRPDAVTPRPQDAKRRVRVVFEGNYICDTNQAIYVWEHPYYPYFYVPKVDMKWDNLHAQLVETLDCDRPGEHWHEGTHVLIDSADIWQVSSSKTGKKKFEVIHFREMDCSRAGRSLNGYVRLPFGEMDAWYEEESPIFVHPKDPTKRIFVLPSTRPLSFCLQDTRLVLATSTSYYRLIEGDLPVRFYIPMTCIDPSMLRPSKTITKCPYKGDAEYFDVVVNHEGKQHTIKDLIWWYRYPEQEVASIAGYACFYNEKVDVWLDGARLPRAKSKFV